MALAPVPPPATTPPPVRSYYANDSARQFSPFANARYGVGSAAATEQDLAQRVFQQGAQYQAPQQQQFPGAAGGASPANLQQRQFGSQ